MMALRCASCPAEFNGLGAAAAHVCPSRTEGLPVEATPAMIEAVSTLLTPHQAAKAWRLFLGAI